MLGKFRIAEIAGLVRQSNPLIQCITNFVTVNDCANIILAFGGTPVMADVIDEVTEFTDISNGVNINLGAMVPQIIKADFIAGKHANNLNIPVTFDPVGVGASKLRNDTATRLLNEVKFAAIRGNMSEMKVLTTGWGKTKGVDVSQCDVITESNWIDKGKLLCEYATSLGTVLAASGSIDIVTDGKSICGIKNGSSKMARITGSGCMLTSVLCLWIATARMNPSLQISDFEATVAAIATYGVCGEIADEKTIEKHGGSLTFRTELIDAASLVLPEVLANRVRIDFV